ncbi:hypothetical protein RFI_15882 [Reticulomyxa filosa]|uniref:Protein ENHANCED DISEASE RESISTANCE 2 C-terminal domain-containing protein n=1 Tax=Reticulomyxa filosa TaxID=46433 RepID=X6N5N6_RETFI|nr:hypothetical protein RFI_15882 [Reticulomyxa filosa]|eukprot:ETO21321.1 hypothetical protein RFI_15882 [Reticulomyxa filosa]
MSKTEKTKKDEKNSKSKKIKKNRRTDNQLSNFTWPDCVQPSGKTHWGEWKETNAKHISVRSDDYITVKKIMFTFLFSRKKIKSKRSLLKLAYQEFIEATLEESRHIATHEHSWYKNNHTKLPKDTFHLIVSIQLQSIKIAIISYYVMRTDDSLFGGSESNGDDTRAENGLAVPAVDNEAETLKSSSSMASNSELKTNGNNPMNASSSGLNTENLKLYNELMELQEHENTGLHPIANFFFFFFKKTGCVFNVCCYHHPYTQSLSIYLFIFFVCYSIHFDLDTFCYASSFFANFFYGFVITDFFWEKKKKKEEKEAENKKMKKSATTSWSFMPKIHYAPLDGNFSLPNNNNNNTDNNSIWKQFLSNNHSLIHDRLKLIPHVEKYSPSRTYRGENYLEVDIEADSTKLAQKVVKGAHGVSKQIIVDIVWVIEGCKAAELPERCLGGVRLFNVDVTKVTPLKKWDDDTFTKNSAADETEESESEALPQESYEVDDKEIMGVD